MDRELLVYGVLGAVGLGATAIGVYVLGKKWRQTRSSENEPSNPYETKKLVNEYMGFHYCPPEEYVSYSIRPKEAMEFPKRCADLCILHKQKGVLSRAFDIGCAVGRSSFELAREFEEVVGMDYSDAFIAKCQELKITGQAKYELTVEGDLVDEKSAVIDPTLQRTRVQFTVGDACNLPDLGRFGCVFAGNLICRLPEPMKFFDRLKEMIVPGGILVITSPYTWLEQYTSKSKWIGGYSDEAGGDVRGIDTLHHILGDHFDLIEEQNMPFLIRETVRKHQWTVAHATVWKRKMA